MATLRFNHMELTVPPGTLGAQRDEIKTFYGEVFGFEALDVPILNQTGLLLRTDPETSQFLLLTEQKKHLDCPGYDHLGFLYETRAEVDALREAVQKWQDRDARVEIKDYDDLVTGPVTVRAFYVRFLLPIWFDVQCMEHAEGTAPSARWTWG
ncbi:MAG: hypothetical protein VX546_03225 [Myxococcota bacterium]|nr:hypothetical protein [Myxococcota bacterium]